MTLTATEQLVLAAAREIRDDDVVFVGMRLPMRAFEVAKRTHAPGAVGLYECGLVRSQPASAQLVTMADPANVQGASWAGSMTELMGLMAQGYVTLGMVGGAQIDRFGNLNSSYIGGYSAPASRLPGSGGASDIASLAQRLVALMPHERRRFVEEVDYITSPGHGSGSGWREGAGLPRRRGSLSYGGPYAVISTLGTFCFDESGEMTLASLHRGVTVEQVRENTGWRLKISPILNETPPPSPDEIAALRATERA